MAAGAEPKRNGRLQSIAQQLEYGALLVLPKLEKVTRRHHSGWWLELGGLLGCLPRAPGVPERAREAARDEQNFTNQGALVHIPREAP